MKKFFTLLIVLMLGVLSVFAQAPQKMSYQAVVRNANNTLVTNQNVSVRISVLQGSATGSAVYVETHNVQTNANGLMTVEVGTGLPTNGSFDQINWGQGPFYLKSEIDPEGGINYSIEGVQQLLSVPYALYAAKAGNVPSVAVVPTANGYDIVFNGQTFHIENCTSPTVTANQDPISGDVTLTINNNDGSTPTTMTIPAGQDGQQGPAGPQGVAGQNGTSPTVTTTQNPTTGDVTLTINNNDGTTPTTVTIPAGQDGQDGAQGPAGQDGSSPTVTTTQNPNTGDVTVTINNNDGTTPTTVTIPAGVPGRDGNSPTVTTSQNPNTGDVTLTINNNDGTTPATVTIPAGQDGPQGPVGPQGEQGVAGVNGQDGISPTITTNPTPNGTEVTITDANGTHQFTIPNGQQGPQGEQGAAGVNGQNGQDGISPTITTNPTPNGTEVTITDASGTHQFTIPNGEQGPQGEQGVAGVNGQDGVSPIITTNPTPNGTEVTITDASGTHQFTIPNGEQGPAGPQGETGPQGPAGQDGATAEEVAQELISNPTYASVLQGEQGPAGPQGEQGPQGETGPQGPAGQDGVSPTITTNPTENGTEVTITDANGTYQVVIPNGEQGPQGETGPQGPAGQDGVSPTITTNPTENGTEVTITDANGTYQVVIPNGEQGPQGEPGEPGASPTITVNPTPNNDGYVINITDVDGNIQSVTVTNGQDMNSIIPPIVLTKGVTLTDETARLKGYISYYGNDSTYSVGMEWGTDPDSLVSRIENTDLPVSTPNSVFAITVANVMPSTTYYFRAYGRNGGGTTYGEIMSFTTPSTFVEAQPCQDAPTVTDIDGNVYNTVQIGNQCWMKENMRTTRFPSGAPIPNSSSYVIPGYQTNNGNYYYNAHAALLGQRTTVGNNQGVCPNGWHIPSIDDWIELDVVPTEELFVNGNNHSGFSALALGYFISSNYYAGIADFATSKVEAFSAADDYDVFYSYNLYNPDFGNSSYGYSRYGTRYVSVRCIRGNGITFPPTVVLNEVTEIMSSEALGEWTVVTDGGSPVTQQGLCWNTTGNPTVADQVSTGVDTELGNHNFTMTGLLPQTTYYVRAFATNANGTTYSDSVIMFTTTAIMNQPCPNAPTVTDYDGNVYNTVQIGNQCWMKEDLRTKHYANGEEIRAYQDDVDLMGFPYYYTNMEILPMTNSNQTTSAPSNTNVATTDVRFVYSAMAIINGSKNHGESAIQGVCPEGWHVPTMDDLTILMDYSSMSNADSANTYEYQEALMKSYSNTTGFDGACYMLFTGNRAFYRYNGPALSYGTSSVFMDEYEGLSLREFATYGLGMEAYLMPVRCIKGAGITTAPAVSDVKVLERRSNSVYVSWETFEDGGANVTQQGVCWNTTGNPTTSDNVVVDTNFHPGYGFAFLSSLEPSTTYYIRAFATNANGITYSDSVMVFTTTVLMSQPCPDAPTVTDYDGNVYNTVQIGDQCWMKENLRATHTPSGARLVPYQPSYTNPSIESTDPMYYIPGNNGHFYFANAYTNGLHITANTDLVQGICPAGWHLPTHNEWFHLQDNINVSIEELADVLFTSGSNITGFSAEMLPYVSYQAYSYDLPSLRLADGYIYMQNNQIFDDMLTYNSINGMVCGSQNANVVALPVRCIKGDGITFPPTVILNEVTEIMSNEALGELIVTTDGGSPVTYKGLCWNTTGNPTLNDQIAAEIDTLLGSGNYNITMTGLEPNTTYYVRAFATNINGTSYSDTVLVFTTPVMMNQPCPDAPTVTDYDGNVYNTVQIGNQCWMKENLRTTHTNTGAVIEPYQPAYTNPQITEHDPMYYVPGNNGHYYFANAYTNGLHITAETDLVQGICPAGWHLPTFDEWRQLYANLNVPNEDVLDILFTSGSNSTGFSAETFPYVTYWSMGYDQPRFSIASGYVHVSNNTYYDNQLFFSDNGRMVSGGQAANVRAIPVRCIKGDGITFPPTVILNEVTEIMSNEALGELIVTTDGGSPVTYKGLCWNTTGNPTLNDQIAAETDTLLGSGNYNITMTGLEPNTTYYVRAFATNANGTAYSDTILSFTTPIMMNQPCPDAPTVTDYDGNVYNTVQIGNQCWMKENLKTTHYATGSALASYRNAVDTPKCYLGDNGYYYDYFAMMNGNGLTLSQIENVQGICPNGWHIPSHAEFNTLFDALGGSQAAFDKIMVTGSNASGLSISIDGYYEDDVFENRIVYLKSSQNAYRYMIRSGITPVGATHHSYDPVRCIKNTSDAVTGIPTIVMKDVTYDLTSVSNRPRANLFYDGGKEVTTVGWEYGVSTSDLVRYTDPSFYGQCPKRIYGYLDSLAPNTTYYIRAFATNENGTAYTDFETFTTPAMMNLPCPDAATVTDYDGNVYNTVMIGNQCWTKEDMKTTHYPNGTPIKAYDRTLYDSINGVATRPSYYLAPHNNAMLYNYKTATNGYVTNYYSSNPDTVQGICPAGWHLPLSSEIEELMATLGGISHAPAMLKSQQDWFTPGTNESGFSALPMGIYFSIQNQFHENRFVLKSSVNANNFMMVDGSVCYIGENADFSSVRCVKGQGIVTPPVLDTVGISNLVPESASAFAEILFDGNSSITELGICLGNSFDPTEEVDNISMPTEYTYEFTLVNLVPNTTYYIRAYAKYGNGSIVYGNCIPFTTPSVVMNRPCPDAPMVSDMDGNWYNTVQIGNQCWMKENLRTTTYANGDPISADSLSAKFYILPSNSGYTAARYGLYYSWAAIMNGAPGSYGAPIQGICPSGWHVPSNADWIELNNNLRGGFDNTTGKTLKENSNFWTSGAGNNQTGLSIRPAGYLEYGSYIANNFGTRTEFFTADMISEDNVYYVFFNNDLYRLVNQNPNEYLSSVRCIKGEGATIFPPRVELVGYTVLTHNVARVEAKIVNDGGGITKYGMYLTNRPDEHLPFGLYASFHSSTTNIQNGEHFTFDMNGVTATNYDVYVVAFAVNGADTAYSEPMKIVVMNVPCSTATVRDASGNTYNTVRVGKQCWMKENLRTTKYPSGADIETCDGTNTRYYKHVNNNSSNDAIYGLHYTWAAAMNGAPDNYSQPVQGICPNGWHIPTRAELETLKATVNNDMNALKNTQYWSSTGTTNTSGFSLNPSGYTSYSCSSTSSASIGSSSELMTADQSSSNNYYYFNASGNFSSNGKTSYMDAVRCIKGDGANVFAPEVQTVGHTQNTYNSVKVTGKIVADNGAITSKGICYSNSTSMPTISDSKVTSSANTSEFTCTLTGLIPAKTYYARAYATNSAGTAYGSVDTIKIMNVSCSSSSVSYSGHSYPTVQIGGQCWLKENLRTTKYTTGNDLYYADNFDGTYYSEVYSYVYWNHSSSNASRGLLYGRDHAGTPYFSTSTSNQSGLRGLCPTGWHIPSKAEVNELTSFLGGSYVAGGKLKSTTGWTTPGTNESGFNMTPTGYFQSSTSTFQYGTTNAYFWVTDGQGNTYAAAGCANNNNIVNFYNREVADQVPIRCLKDGATFSNISGVQISGPSNSYNYRVTASFNKSSANSSYGSSSVVECGIEGQDGQRITSSSTSSINVTVSFPGGDSGFPYRCYIKTADGKYYYSESQFLEGFIVN